MDGAGDTIAEALLSPEHSVGGGVSSELEEILSDTNLAPFHRYRKAVFLEMHTLYRLAAPACVVYLLGNVVSMSTQIFCGHLGNRALAASSLGNNGIQLLAYGLMVINYKLILLYQISKH